MRGEITRRQALAAAGLILTRRAAYALPAKLGERVRTVRLPAGAIQPQVAVDEAATLHVVYYVGEGRAGNLFYARSTDGGPLATGVEVNSPGSAIAAGTIRGAQVGLGKAGRVHVAWNGSPGAHPKGLINPESGQPGEPMLYSRLKDPAARFDPQRNLMTRSSGLDGGGTVAADGNGNVYVLWHGIGTGPAEKDRKGEAARRVWVAVSRDNGESFAPEKSAWDHPTGACGCCGMKAYAAPNGSLFALYRSATESIHRDIYLLRSDDRAGSFSGKLLHKWEINACPMTSMDIVGSGDSVFCAWETGGQVFWTSLAGAKDRDPVPAPGEGKGRKHPRLAVNGNGELLMAWTEGTGWQRGGSLAWQVYDASGRPTSERGSLPGVPVWSFAAPFANKDGGFSILF